MAAGLPSAVLVEIEFTAGVWTDVSTSVRGTSIEIKVGRSSKSGSNEPGTLDLDLENPTGTFLPDNPTGTYYPNFVEGKRIRVRVTKSATTYTRFLGRITAITPDFPTEPAQSLTHVAAVDRLGELAGMPLRSPLEMQVLSEASLVAYWPLTESAGALEGVNIAPGSTIPSLVSSNIGKGGSVVFGDADGPTSDGLSAPKISRASATQGRILTSATDVDLGLSGSFTLECWYSTEQVAAAGDVTSTEFIRLARVRNAIPAVHGIVYVQLYSDHASDPVSDGMFAGQGWPGGTDSATGDFGFGSSDPVADGRVHHVVYTESEVAGTVTQTLYFDGQVVGTPGSYTASAEPELNPTRVVIGGSSGGMFTGSVSHVALYDTALSAAQVTDHYQAGAPAAVGDTLDAQLARLSTWTGVTCAFTATSGRAGVLPEIAGKTALEVLSTIANGESGRIYHDYATDQIVVPLAADTRSTTVALTIDAEGDLNGGPAMSRDVMNRVSQATATTPVASALAVDATLVATIGAADVTIESTLANLNDLYSLASAAVADGRDQKTRLSQLTVDLANAGNDLYAAFFAVTSGERARLSGLPSTYFGLTYIDGYVEGWTERPGIDGYEVVFDLSPADAPTDGIYNTSRYAFGDGVCTVTSGTAVGTTSTGTIVLTWSGSQTLSTAAGDYPMDFDWNGERVTVTSAPAGGTSPRTLTITARGVAPTVARSHSAGESIEPWDAARYAP